MTAQLKPKVRCAVYTRKSSEEGLDMEFSSLDAQREACSAYITSQKSAGWVESKVTYDDGGWSGGNIDRPGLRNLLADIEAGRVDVVVVYKFDRLSRALLDFAKLMEIFERHRVTFVSITQSFNTTTSMGRLTLNMLLTFAQFEREVIGERIRDKFAASRRKGMWMGGRVPLGYRVENRKLVIVPEAAETVRMIFSRFAKCGSSTKLAADLRAERITTPTGCLVSKGYLYKLINNRVYLGEAVHKGTSYPGEHQAIIDQDLWNRAHAVMSESPRKRANQNRAQSPALLRGLIFGPDGRAMSPSHTRKQGRLYRYYVSQTAIQAGAAAAAFTRIAAADIESVVICEMRKLLVSPDVIIAVWQAAREYDRTIREAEARKALIEFESLWDELFPAEQARIVQLLVARVMVDEDGASIDLKVEGLQAMAAEILPGRHSKQDAAE